MPPVPLDEPVQGAGAVLWINNGAGDFPAGNNCRIYPLAGKAGGQACRIASQKDTAEIPAPIIKIY